MPNLPKSGRPRRTLDWASTLRYNLPVSFVKDRDIHTAMFLAGTGAVDMVMCAIREYITAHPNETGNAVDPAVQQKVAATALAIAMGVETVMVLAPAAIAPAPPVTPPSPVWVAPISAAATIHESLPVVSVGQTHHVEPDDMVSRLRSAIPGAQVAAIAKLAPAMPAAARVNMVAEISFPDDISSAPSDEARRLEAAHQFAINQLRDA